jgi:hypothetical protein
VDESQSTQPAPEPLQPYDQPAFRLTLSIDLAAGNGVVASMRMMEICRALANLCVDPLAGQALHQLLSQGEGSVLNIVCFNDPTPVDTPLDPAEVSRLQDVVANLQAGGGLEALGALLGGGTPADGNGAGD